MAAKAAVSPEGQDLLPLFGKFALGHKRWVRANLPTGGGMTAPRAMVLLMLANKTEGVSMSDLGELLGMSPRNMTVLADGLEKEGLVRRVPHGRDRRITLVEITDSGREIAKKELGPSHLATAALFDDLTSSERKELKRLLLKLLGSLRARGIEIPTHDQG